MDDVQVGRTIRTLRIRRQWRQIDLAEAAGTSRVTISRIERGHFGSLSFDLIRNVCRALEVRAEITPRWRGGELDRMLGSRHAQLHESVARSISRTWPDWLAFQEVSFNIWGERGVIDLILWHQEQRSLVIVELKTELVDVNELLGTMDRRRRLAPQIARERRWEPAMISAWIVVAAGRTTERRIAAHRSMLRAAYPAGDRAMRSWLARPSGSIAALSTWRVRDGSALATPRRVRVSSKAGAAAGSGGVR